MIQKAWKVGLLRFVILLLLFLSAVWIIGKRFAAISGAELHPMAYYESEGASES